MFMAKKIVILSGLLLFFGIVFYSLSDNFKSDGTKGYFPDLPKSKEPKMAPNDWLAKQHLYPNGKFSHQHYLKGLKQAEALHSSTACKSASWECVGPTNIGGRISDIAIHPDFPDTWYIGAATGGVFKTTNGGYSWNHIFKDAPAISIGALAIDPSSPDILYVGTGEANSGSTSFIGNGMYKTVDAGQTWQHLGFEESAYFGRIVVDYDNPNRVFAAACGTMFSPNQTRGIYRSTDGGQQWQRVLFVTDTTAAIDIVQHPNNPNILYAAMWERYRGLTYRRSHGYSSGIYKTTDGGDTWTLLTNGLPQDDSKGRIGLAIAKNNPEKLYAFIDVKTTNMQIAKVFKTNDGGESWQTTNDNGLSNINRDFGWYFGQIRVDPRFDERIYILGVDLFRSDNGGQTYTQLAGYYNLISIHVDHHALFIHPSNGNLVIGNDGGVYTSSNLGENWIKWNNLPITQFYAIEIDYLLPHRIGGGTQDNNTIFTFVGANNGWDRILGGDGFYTIVDYTNSDIIYAEYQWGNLFRSDDRGDSFIPISGQWRLERTNWSSPYVIHPTNPNILYFGSNKVYRTTNKGNSWQALSGDLTRNLTISGFSTISTMAISKLNPYNLLVGSDDGYVHISTTGGGVWTNISQGLPNRWITRVAFDPFDTNTIYATVSGLRWDEPHSYVFKSTNLGSTWVDIGGNLPEFSVYSFVADPGRPNHLYVGTVAGIFGTKNGGTEWFSLSNGIPNVPVFDLKIHEPTRMMVAGTYGASAYKINLDEITGLENSNEKPASTLLFQDLYPNPVLYKDETLNIEYYIPSSGNHLIQVFDMRGRLVATLSEGHIRGGAYVLKWNLESGQGKRIPAGVYILNLRMSRNSESKKFVVN
jgi:photosystem II stability/assembly factor-like uncharacterized protein